jgi:predicted DNA-binding transcriptional regulator AlpA
MQVTYLTRREAAQRLGVAEQTLRHWAVADKGPARHYLNGRVRYVAAEVDSWIQACNPAGDAEVIWSNVTAAVSRLACSATKPERLALADRLQALAESVKPRPRRKEGKRAD